MSTTRHHINRQRRRQARETRPAPFAGTRPDTGSRSGTGGTDVLPPPSGPAADATTPRKASGTARKASGTAGEASAAAGRDSGATRGAPGATDDRGTARTRRGPRRPATTLAVLCVLTLLLGGFAGWAHARAEALRDDPARSNTALTDLARTSEIKGQASRAVEALFSYDHTDPGALEEAARDLLTEKAVSRHATLLADVRERADEQKALITTTVTESAVERIDGDRARVLVYADQSSVATAGTGPAADKGGKAARGERERRQDEGVYAGALLAVDVVHRDGRWLVSAIDTFGR
ncbi:hypothetical protein [Streptomyces prasinopilosus]|uniref:Mce-associated membrane protein n=1 Tax=Streptomyces prasinopilosus TaxID=67344 RepID=A0A1G6J9L6_9ACTN|nr:hypothetical protein [Streptomyces prasinopilosus]SDC15055.1 Mce-associated membrane protein [Streptomyces prasinopilosus]